jgi:hypothetical protein
MNEDIVGALLAGGSIGAAERAETKYRLLINHLQEVWVYKQYGLEQKVQTCTQTFRTSLALEKGAEIVCEKMQLREAEHQRVDATLGGGAPACRCNFGRRSTSEAAQHNVASELATWTLDLKVRWRFISQISPAC